MTKKNKLQAVIDQTLTINNTSSKDKSFITEICYGVVRNYYFIEYHINYHCNQKKINKKLQMLLMIGIYQIRFLDSIPNYAAVNTTVELSKKLFPHAKSFINAILRNINRHDDVDINIPIDVEKSCPNWLFKLYIKDFGKDETLKLLDEQNRRPIHWIRTNKNLKEIKNILFENDVGFKEYNYNHNYLSVKSLNNIIIKDLLKKGKIYIQSPSSGHVVDILDPCPEDRIVDGCSSPGGKLTDIYFKCNKLKSLYSYEVNYDRYKLLNKNIKTMKINNVLAVNKSFLDCNDKHFNKILIDVPCSGTGSINKKPDIKIRRKFQDYKYFNKIQTSLLTHAAKILKYGSIVYSTCSLNNLENWDIIDNFLYNNDKFKVSNLSNLVPKNYIDKKGALFIKPHKHKLDGIFAVKLEIQND